ncbi:hypothetical protein EM308_03110 [Flavobacterium gilvum]|uniref:Fibronectin type III-like domain-containing protein n=3 Tax=Flavobacterium gilvum TaxID=1492737 RepID=A0AAC9I5F8_9FLAO|nr:hypothetical protein EM308_03110 [Flavobacterium gilvum]
MIIPQSESIEKKVNDLLAKMTLEEKVYQLNMMCFGAGKNIAENAGLSGMDIFKKEGAKIASDFEANSVGSIARLPSDLDMQIGVDMINMLQKHAKEKTRLGVPLMVTNAGLHGLAVKGMSCFPQSIAMAATFNPALMEEIANAIGKETHSYGVRQLLTPVLDLGREPRHGRVEETFGEDPYLASRMGVAFIRGVQSNGVICTPKHFLANYVGDGGREGVNVTISERELRETHLVPYEAAVKEAGALGIMTAYNAINGVACTANPWLLTDVLRKEWGFQGIVVSDASSVNYVHLRHKHAATKGEAAALCLKAGLDVDLPRVNYYKELIGEVKEGCLSTEVLDESVRRMLRLKFRLGLFENAYGDLKETERIADAPDHRKLALTAARQSIVLLKNNESVLPLNSNLKKIAVIGPNADKLSVGGYSAADVKGNTPLTALKNYLGKEVVVKYAKGCGLVGEDTSGIDEAVKIANESDICVLFMGGAYGVTGGEGSERATLELMGQQELLIEKVTETGKPVVVVLLDGRPVVMNRWIKKVKGVVMAFYPGEEGGNAIAEVLTGKCNPSGKLPITFPMFTGQAPLTYDYRPYGREGGYAELPANDDRYIPQFPFGFGLSYTTFSYSNLKCTPEKSKDGVRVKVKVDVTNTGALGGDEVVQLYLSNNLCRITQPNQRLKGFSRIHLESKETKSVELILEAKDLSFLNEELKPEVGSGSYSVKVGSDCLHGLTETFKLTF